MMISRRVPTRHVHRWRLIQILDHRPFSSSLAGTLSHHAFQHFCTDRNGRCRISGREQNGRRRLHDAWLHRIADQHRGRRRILRPVHIPFHLLHRHLPNRIARYLPVASELCCPILPNRSCIHIRGQGIWARCVHSPRKGRVTRNTRSTGNAGRNARTGRNTPQHLLDPIHLGQHTVHQQGFSLLGQACRFSHGRTLLQQSNMVQRCLRLSHRQRQQVDHALQAQRLLLHVRLGITTRTSLRRSCTDIPVGSTLRAPGTRHRHTV